MAFSSGQSSLKSVVASSSAPTPAKRSINGLSLMLSQRLSSTTFVLPATSKDDDEKSSPPSLAAAAVALLPPVPSTCALADEGGEAVKGGGHFAQFRSQNFQPDDSAPFSDEWERLRASQGWVPGSQAYKRERALALRNELRACYFPSSSNKIDEGQKEESTQTLIKNEEGDIIKEGGGGGEDHAGETLALETQGDAEEDRVSLAELMGFQAMCRDVGQQPRSTLDECKATLRATLVNIVDLIDSHRTGRAVQVWTDFNSFRAYTTRPDKTMPLEEAKEDELLKCFLKKIRTGGGRSRGRDRRSVGKRVKTRAPSLGAGLDGKRKEKTKRLRREM